tara:strand:- start:1016 stop:1573 length:558 start_codon:yes stop_codon:yes gene_type:complete
MTKKARIIFYDLETTGVDPENDEIIEIGAKDNYGNIYEKLINPNKEIPKKIEELTGITNNKIKYRNSLEQSYNNIEEWFNFDNKNIYLIAHNGDNFDYKFLSKYFDIKCKCIDTLILYRKLLPYQRSHSIKTLCETYNIDSSKHHRALEDVLILEKLYNKAKELYCIIFNKKKVTDKQIYEYIYS